MSETNWLGPGDATTLTEALTATDPRTRMLARAAATDIGQATRDWLAAEIERGSDPVHLLPVLARFQVAVFASLVGHLLSAKDDEHARAMLLMEIELTFDRTAAHARAEAERADGL